MGLVGWAAEKAAEGIAKKVAVHVVLPAVAGPVADACEKVADGCGKLADRAEAAEERYTKRLFDHPAGTHVLVFTHNYPSLIEDIRFYDKPKSVKYYVKGKLVSAKHHLRVFDASDCEVGRVDEKLFSIRLPLLHEIDPADFDIEIGGISAGRVRSTQALVHRNYSVDFNGWKIEGNPFGIRYKMLDGQRVVAEMSRKILSGNETCVITYQNQEEELLVLMLSLAVEAAFRTKTEETHDVWSYGH